MARLRTLPEPVCRGLAARESAVQGPKPPPQHVDVPIHLANADADRRPVGRASHATFVTLSGTLMEHTLQAPSAQERST